MIVILLGCFLLNLVELQANKKHLAMRDSYLHCTVIIND